MNLSAFKKYLESVEGLHFELPNGEHVPSHFHVTEVGQISKHFIDCGGTVRQEHKVNFQLWEAEDYDHRLQAEKLLKIIQLSEDKLQMGDYEIEVEYQGETIGKYGIEFSLGRFQLVSLSTDCLAKENCGVTNQKPKMVLSEMRGGVTNSCTPGGGCC